MIPKLMIAQRRSEKKSIKERGTKDELERFLKIVIETVPVGHEVLLCLCETGEPVITLDCARCRYGEECHVHGIKGRGHLLVAYDLFGPVRLFPDEMAQRLWDKYLEAPLLNCQFDWDTTNACYRKIPKRD
jgi:hypothetical protein